eukprot:GILJ01010885.1.p1 GENE.GILJ01010885.1~~GILJ01010885.1.p1  ORF type:complete len:378 (+),score=49.22 GILJ01010885.1:132-1265(+)
MIDSDIKHDVRIRSKRMHTQINVASVQKPYKHGVELDSLRRNPKVSEHTRSGRISTSSNWEEAVPSNTDDIDVEDDATLFSCVFLNTPTPSYNKKHLTIAQSSFITDDFDPQSSFKQIKLHGSRSRSPANSSSSSSTYESPEQQVPKNQSNHQSGHAVIRNRHTNTGSSKNVQSDINRSDSPFRAISKTVVADVEEDLLGDLQTMSAEELAVVKQKIVETVEHIKHTIRNKFERKLADLNSLGIFDVVENRIRTESMYRVELKRRLQLQMDGIIHEATRSVSSLGDRSVSEKRARESQTLDEHLRCIVTKPERTKSDLRSADLLSQTLFQDMPIVKHTELPKPSSETFSVRSQLLRSLRPSSFRSNTIFPPSSDPTE